MSHRTNELPELQGLRHVIRELRYHEVSRQLGAVALILVYALVSEPTVPLIVAGLSIGLVGVALRLYASGFIVKNRELATAGPYALVRHPLYTGNILLLLGFSIASGLWWCLLASALFFWFYYPPAIEYEDRKLRRLFTAEWDRWAADVPALVPALRKLGHLGGSWSFGKSMRSNGEGVIALYVIACMIVVLFRLP